MAFSRARYDTCAYNKSLKQSTSTLTWQIDPNRYYRCNECAVPFGVVGGNSVSRYQGNLVDLESDLFGITRAYSECPSQKFQPGTIIQGVDSTGCRGDCMMSGLPCGSKGCQKRPIRVKDLPSCPMFNYKPRPTSTGILLPGFNCPSKSLTLHGGNARVPLSKEEMVRRWQGSQATVRGGPGTF